MEVNQTLKDDENEDEISLQPSGSRTLAKSRLNPEAAEFVPSLSSHLLATKIFDELNYTRWSSNNNLEEDISYGPRHDAIWSESFNQFETQSIHMESSQHLEQLSLKERSGSDVDPDAASGPRGRCCPCQLM
ncbi:uncharacterized protein LOC116805305 isoform X2 [Drosophila grimshawi]|uniref:uncharacterized protein LOC116805305 isoform X2 n=1 Tax=Drosophila grimshawi TaxID=7222 RepID=UPI000C86F758|nr:uncharacterized protein LOC116805305 isoform X2 [Drosophila grimshawi]